MNSNQGSKPRLENAIERSIPSKCFLKMPVTKVQILPLAKGFM